VVYLPSCCRCLPTCVWPSYSSLISSFFFYCPPLEKSSSPITFRTIEFFLVNLAYLVSIPGLFLPQAMVTRPEKLLTLPFSFERNLKFSPLFFPSFAVSHFMRSLPGLLRRKPPPFDRFTGPPGSSRRSKWSVRVLNNLGFLFQSASARRWILSRRPSGTSSAGAAVKFGPPILVGSMRAPPGHRGPFWRSSAGTIQFTFPKMLSDIN